mgnify:FL=1
MNDIEQDTSCRACGEPVTTPIAINNFFLPEKDPTLWTDGFCSVCGTISHFSRPSTSVIKYHDSAYRERGYELAPPISLPWSTVTFERYRHINNYLSTYIEQLPQTSDQAVKHLDFGGYNGFMSYGLRQLHNFHSTIADLDPRGLAIAEALGMSTINLARSELPTGAFDIITAIQVVEHLEDPFDTLNLLSGAGISTGAILYCEVPNIMSFPTREPSHFTTFSPRGLKELFARSGFQVLEMGYCTTPSVAVAFTWPYFSPTESIYLIATNGGTSFLPISQGSRESIRLFIEDSDHLDYSTFQRSLHSSGARLGLRNAGFYAKRGGKAVLVNLLKALIALLFLMIPSTRVRNYMTRFLGRSKRLAAMRSS